MKKSLGDNGESRLFMKDGDTEIAVKTDSDDSDDEYDSNWKLVKVSKETYRKFQSQMLNSKYEKESKSVVADGVGSKQQQNQPSVIRVTNYVPTNDRASIRERSICALDRTRATLSERTGLPPRLIVDESTGFLLSRDTVDNTLYEASSSKQQVNHFHYQSSVDALERLRDLRLMRRLDQALGE